MMWLVSQIVHSCLEEAHLITRTCSNAMVSEIVLSYVQPPPPPPSDFSYLFQRNGVRDRYGPIPTLPPTLPPQPTPPPPPINIDLEGTGRGRLPPVHGIDWERWHIEQERRYYRSLQTSKVSLHPCAMSSTTTEPSTTRNPHSTSTEPSTTRNPRGRYVRRLHSSGCYYTEFVTPRG